MAARRVSAGRREIGVDRPTNSGRLRKRPPNRLAIGTAGYPRPAGPPGTAPAPRSAHAATIARPASRISLHALLARQGGVFPPRHESPCALRASVASRRAANPSGTTLPIRQPWATVSRPRAAREVPRAAMRFVLRVRNGDPAPRPVAWPPYRLAPERGLPPPALNGFPCARPARIRVSGSCVFAWQSPLPPGGG